MVLEKMKAEGTLNSWNISGFDIDPLGVAFAKRAIYPVKELRKIPEEFRSFTLCGTGKTEGYFTLSKSLRESITFQVHDIREALSFQPGKKFDALFCRNVLIYFDEQSIDSIVSSFQKRIVTDGLLVIGHNEFFNEVGFDFSKQSAGIYQRNSIKPRPQTHLKPKVFKTESKPTVKPDSNANRKKKILVVDDSATILKILSKILGSAGYEVLTVNSGVIAFQLLKQQTVDLITLDINMPEMDGKTWLKEFRKSDKKTPVVVVSSTSPKAAVDTLGALESGAQHFIEKNFAFEHPEDFLQELKAICSPKQTSKKFKNKELPTASPEIFLLGSSTGGTRALIQLLENFGSQSPPVVVVQHIAHSFAEPFAQRLEEASGLKLYTSSYPVRPENGYLYMAFGDFHLKFKKNGNLFHSNDKPRKSHRPSVDVLFESAAKFGPSYGISVLLTGMGKDGAVGTEYLHNRGYFTCAQDQQSSVVFGMPRAAIEKRAVDFVGNIATLRECLDQSVVASYRSIA